MKPSTGRSGPWALCLALGVISGALFSCNGGDEISRAKSTADVTGRWTGVTAGGDSVDMDLSQTLNEVTGSARFEDLEGGLTGAVDGNRLEATIASVRPRVIFATVSDTAMSGTYRDVSGGILGNFTAGR